MSSSPPSSRDLQIFSGLQVVFWGLIAWMLTTRFEQPAFWLLPVIAATVSLAGLWRPDWIEIYRKGWMAAVAPIGWLVSRVVLAIVYFLVITPIGLIRRLRGHDPLALRADPTASSYWVARQDRTDPASYFRQF
jgi:hypothetical protein